MKLKYHFREKRGHHETPPRRVGTQRSDHTLLVTGDFQLNIEVGAITKSVEDIFQHWESIPAAVSQVEVIRGSDVPSIPTAIVPANIAAVTGVAGGGPKTTPAGYAGG